MIHYSEEDIEELDKVYRINLINSCSGYKSANLIGTKSKSGISNVAVFSSIVHLGSSPPLLGFFDLKVVLLNTNNQLDFLMDRLNIFENSI